MKLRIDGTEQEISKFVENLSVATQIENHLGKIKSVSKFYPNHSFSHGPDCKETEGRVYLEISE